MAAATPAGRDRYVDFLRVASMVVVVLGHWLMAVVVFEGGRLRASNVLETVPDARWLTWALQVMPLFFVVGGYANAASWAAAGRDGLGYGTWLGTRLGRLVRPALVFAAVWSALVLALRATGVDPGAVRAGSIAQPLWFLAVYVVVVALAPAAVAVHRCWGGWAAVALAATVAAADAGHRALGLPLVVWANLAAVWLFAHQLGVIWRLGLVSTWSKGRLLAMAVGALVGLGALCGGLGYAVSMVGGTDEGWSNTFPPSFALVAVAVWQFATALALRPVADRWLARPRAWTAVVAANGLAMTFYLWHMTALLAVSALTLPTGLLPETPTGTAAWWAWRPVWVALSVAALVPLVAVFARTEAPAPRGARAAAAVTTTRALVATGLAAGGMAVLARHGFTAPAMPLGVPVVALALVALAYRLLSPAHQ